MTRGVGTLCYQAPEILLGHQKYSCAVDLWSAGCILADMLDNRFASVGAPLFMGKNWAEQLETILAIVHIPANKKAILEKMALDLMVINIMMKGSKL